MKSKSLFVVLCMCYSLSFGIGDFAPIQKGTQWDYQYYYLQRNVMGYETTESLTIRINLVEITTILTDTIICLQVNKKGLWSDSNWTTNPAIVQNSVVSETFIDTVFVRDNKIVKGNNYRSPIFPFWNTHNITVDSLLIGKINGQEVFYYSVNANYATCIYAQDVGLIHYKQCYSRTMMDFCTEINIITHNGNNCLLPVNNYFHESKSASNQFSKIKTMHSSAVPKGNVFDLIGRAFIIGNNCSGGIIVQNNKNR